MVTTETITIEVPVGMSKYLEVINPESNNIAWSCSGDYRDKKVRID